ncbi:MAG TPA: dephospho-CoA kinase [Armatimonadota bacterium]|nr:dephospho-CoA kinase [Armatimonadota bacterium]HQK95845.1 dephospho-CoA kinase [Armatimonadota bacterium]
MYVLGITGPIAAGKTTVMGLFVSLGAEALAADDLTRELMAPGSALVAAIADEFGASFLLSDGSLDRRALGRMVFADPDALSRLNRIVHPTLKDTIARRIHQARSRPEPPPVLVVEAAVMGEMGALDLLDGLLYVDADEATRVRRLVQRDGMDLEEATCRVRAQEAVRHLAKKANWVMDGAQDLDALRAQCVTIYKAIGWSRPSS